MSTPGARTRPTVLRRHGISEFVVPPGSSFRLDLFLAQQVPGLSRRQTRQLLETEAVLINGRRGRKGMIVHPRDVVRIEAVDRQSADQLAAQAELPVKVLYEDMAMAAVDKPAGMPAVALRVEDRDTVANFLVGRYPDAQQASENALEAGVVHRLDTGTSGVMLAARTPSVYRKLRRRFHRREVDKLYLALVRGDLIDSGSVQTPIAHASSRHRMCVCADPDRADALRARPAVTFYRPIRRFGLSSLVAVAILTGVRHQIRVHLASIGHPLLGDPLYGQETSLPPSVVRPMLHATRIRLDHPLEPVKVVIRATIPSDFRHQLRLLRQQSDR